MIDYTEKHNADGTSDIYMASDELPRGYDGRKYTSEMRYGGTDEGYVFCFAHSIVKE